MELEIQGTNLFLWSATLTNGMDIYVVIHNNGLYGVVSTEFVNIDLHEALSFLSSL